MSQLSAEPQTATLGPPAHGPNPPRSHIRRKRRTRQAAGWTLRWSPAIVLAFLALFGLTFITALGSKGAVLFLVCGLGLAASNPAATVAGLRENWLVVVMALWCLVSFTWSDYPALSIRYGVQLCLSVLIAVAMFVRVTPIEFVKILLVLQAMAGFGSILSGRTRADGLGFLGLYGSKNAMAGAASMMIIVSISVLVDRRMSLRWRGLALGTGLLGAALLLMGQSTGALIAVAGVVLTLVLIIFLQRLAPMTRLVCIALAVVVLLFGGIMAAAMTDQIAQTVLNATGKDVTLTGRTDLWGFALREIAKHPLLGAGYQAVWVQGNPLAEELWAMFGIDARAGFHFHNTLLSNAVEIGIIGAALQAIVFFGGLAAALGWAIHSRSAPAIFFSLLMVRQLLLMGVEVVFFFQFEIVTVMCLAAIHYGRRYQKAARAGYAVHSAAVLSTRAERISGRV